MKCLKCGRNYDDPSIKFCISCRIPLPRYSPDTESRETPSLFEVTDGGGGKRINYISPTHTYDTELIRPVLEAGYHYSRNEVSADYLLEKLQDTKKRFEDFKNTGLPKLLDRLESTMKSNVAVECCRQMIYLVGKGVLLFEEGICDLTR